MRPDDGNEGDVCCDAGYSRDLDHVPLLEVQAWECQSKSICTSLLYRNGGLAHVNLP